VLSLFERLRTSHAAATVAAVLLLIVGCLVVVYPGVLAWIAGIALVLTGVSLLVSVYVPRDTSGS
jgi:hypothetical protein